MGSTAAICDSQKGAGVANLKVFVSSTCYDLQAIRGQLRSMLSSMGYEPVMSDQSDVIYDPRIHTHSSCLREVENCDLVVLIVGSRFGGVVVPKALEAIDFEQLKAISRSDKTAEFRPNISITQAEVLQAIQIGLPVFAFIDVGVMRDHLTYEKNKKKPIISQIDFSSIDKSETAPYIFEFINFLRLRSENNSVFEFSRFEDIEAQLKRQWGGLFQRLLHEQRTRSSEGRRIDTLSGQIADLKAAVLGSISNDDLKATAKGAIRFRHVIDFVYGLTTAAMRAGEGQPFNYSKSLFEYFESLDIQEVKPTNGRNLPAFYTALIKSDRTYYQARVPIRSIDRLAREWDEFRMLPESARNAIFNAVVDSGSSRITFLVRYRDEPFEEGSGSKQEEVDLEDRGDSKSDLNTDGSQSAPIFLLGGAETVAPTTD